MPAALPPPSPHAESALPTAGSCDRERERARPSSAHGTDAARPARLLVVDDDPPLLESTARALTACGFIVECAHTAGEAVARAVLEPPDLIVVDLLLPGADGVDLVEALRDEPETCSVPMVACTALGDREVASLLGAVGFDGGGPKPVDWSRWAPLLEAWARRGRG